MFGILRPCRHRLPGDLAKTWLAHLCGLCLALRDDHGQLARTVTNYDGLVISALVEAQTATARRRMAGPCALRAMKPASVAEGSGARLAAAVSLVLASAKINDHVEDRDGVFGRRPVAGAARRVATRWARQGDKTGADIGFSTAVLLDAVGRQGEVESALGLGSSVLTATEPTEAATSKAFAHTALLAERPENLEPLSEAGRLFGRVAHLIDAVEDLEADKASGAWNPLTATGTSIEEARRLCDDAVMGVRLALSEATFSDSKLVHALLVHELGAAVGRTFRAHYPQGPQGPYGPPGPNGPYGPPQQPYGAPGPHQGHGHQPYGQQGWQRPGPPLPPMSAGPPPPGATGPEGPPPPPKKGRKGRDIYEPSRCLCWKWPKLKPVPQSRGMILGCAACLYECGTCQQCCRDPFPGPWSGKPHDACGDCDCGSCDNCCCDCCDCSC
ncbi:hypothetical protein SAMN05192558_105451 [Actinokineospora alba]|uniref:Regulatory protein n=1 Tax=Actinokineospora alba TaxID=504798 RepID=A0A1H0NRM6_9PSEU|nr:DUF5685 family protein [Actinokineospora alba]TDP68819.1 hypothetical protein C8E96_4386 [Actinokineospora alba]SDH87352.1 hypothetical protein SAMN05421871_102501 [Actinokineospora alba]SDO95273.1 hypothetical protein SAMN05192558_105451 [Actinokineospora alba]